MLIAATVTSAAFTGWLLHRIADRGLSDAAPAALPLISGVALLIAMKAERNRAQRRIDGFVSELSSELRSPITVMLAASRVLMEPGSGISDEARGFVERAGRSAERVQRLVIDLHEAFGEQAVASSSKGLVDVAVTLRAAAASAGRATVDAEAGVVAIGDPDRLQRSCEHLVRIASLNSSGLVMLRARPEGNTVGIRVTAGGSITQPAVNGSISDAGIRLVRRLVISMGGTLRVHSPREFSFAIPSLASQQNALLPRARWSVSAATPAAASGTDSSPAAGRPAAAERCLVAG